MFQASAASSNRVHTACCFWRAMSSAEVPFQLLRGSPFAASRILRQSAWPFWAEMYIGEEPSLKHLLTSPPDDDVHLFDRGMSQCRVVVLYLVLGFVFVSRDECDGGGKCGEEKSDKIILSMSRT